MNIQVNPHTITVTRTVDINAGEYNITSCVFEFSEEYTGLTKQAVFTTCDNTYKVPILNNQCTIPSEVLETSGQVLLGVYGYELQDDELFLRYSPTPQYFSVSRGSYVEGNDPDLPKPSEWEQVLALINQAITETNNLNIEVEKEGSITIVTLTKKDGTTQTVQIEDGKSLEFNWQGTYLGVRQEGQSEYQYVNLKGDKGDKGDKGEQGIQGPTGPTGNGISSIEKTSTSGLVDTYTITFTNGNTTTFDVSNGNGIDRIEKTATVGNIDTYTIYFNDNSTSTFEVANGEVTKEELEEEVDRLSMIYNLFPTTSDEDTEMTLDGTGEVKLKKIGLKGNTYQYSTTGKNKLVFNLTTMKSYNSLGTWNNNVYSWRGLSATINDDGTFKVSSGTTTDTFTFYLYKDGTDKRLSLSAGTYTFSSSSAPAAGNGNLVFKIYDNEGQAISGVSNVYLSGSTTSATRTINENFQVAVYLQISNGSTETQKDYAIQIETGNEATSYEPYTNGASPNPDYPQDIQVVSGDNSITIANNDNTQSQTYPINLGSIELCKIGDYQDYIYKDSGKWYLNKQIGKVVLDGSETYYINTKSDNFLRFTYDNSNIKIADNNTDIFCKCNNFKGVPYQTIISTGLNQIALSNNTNRLFININPELIGATSSMTISKIIALFKTWLSTHNTTVYYVLAAPTTTEITDTTLIEQLDNLENAYSYDTQTNISQTNADKPFILDVEAILSLKGVLNS